MKRAIYSVVLTLIAISMWQCARERVEPVSSDMAQQLALMPQSTSGLAYINLEKMRQSPFYEMMQDSLRNRMRQHRELDEFAEATGFDIREDVREVYLSFDPNPQKREGNFLIVALGQYYPQKIMDYIAAQDSGDDLSEESYEDFKLYRIRNKEYVFSFVNENYMVGGKENFVKSWLDNFESGKTDETDNKKLAERVKELKYKSGAWFTMNTAALMDKVMDEISGHGDVRKYDALRAVQNVQFSMNVNDEIKFDGAGNFSDDEKAKLFHDAIKGGLATIKLSLSGDRDAIDVINKININTENSSVKVDGKMNREDVEKLMLHRKRLAAK
jgi:hypothetical protein